MIALAVAAAVASAPAPAAAPSRLFVEGREFSFVLSRLAVRPGRVLVQFRNAGEDPHDLVFRRVRGTRHTARVGEAASLALLERTVRLRPGRYAVLCTLPGHAGAGMRATLRVR